MSTSNEDGSHDCAPVMWAYGIPCPAMVSPNASQHKEDKLLYPDHYLVWYAEVDSGPHTNTNNNQQVLTAVTHGNGNVVALATTGQCLPDRESLLTLSLSSCSSGSEGKN